MEEFRSINGYEGFYEFSNLNNVKSLSRFIKRGNNGYMIKERILKKCLNNGYYVVNLSLNGKYKTFSIHQLVAMEHLGHVPCGTELVIDHIDTNKENNNIDNLRITTNRINSNKKHIKHTSKYTGVCWDKQSKKWGASISINSKKKHLGFFTDEEEASRRYENALFCHNNNNNI